MRNNIRAMSRCRPTSVTHKFARTALTLGEPYSHF